MEPLALLGLAGVLFVKEAGLPLPIPGDLLVVSAGIASAGQANLPGPVVLAVILIAGYVGGSVQFLLVRGALRRVVLAILERLGVGQERLDRLAAWLSRRGARGVAVARATPAVRVGAIAAKVANREVGGHEDPIAHEQAADEDSVLQSREATPWAPRRESSWPGSVAPALAFVVLVVFAVLGAFGWSAVRRRRGGTSPESTRDGGYAGWVEGACPACLLLTVVGSAVQQTVGSVSDEARMPGADW